MFYGAHEHTIDRKGRLIIPSKFRELCKEHLVERLYATRGLDGCLFLFAEEEWRLLESRFKSVSFTRAEGRQFNRLFFSGACEVIPDKQGRILLPKELKDYAQLKRDVIVVGVSNRLEIWALERWRAFTDESLPRFEDVAEKFLGE